MVSCFRDLQYLSNACLSYLSSDNESYVKCYHRLTDMSLSFIDILGTEPPEYCGPVQQCNQSERRDSRHKEVLRDSKI